MVETRFGAAAVDRLERFAGLLISANARQNLIAPSTVPVIWERHLLDSAQLADIDSRSGLWLDIGSGGGLPGLVVALLLDRPFVLCEPRRLRAAFLAEAVETLGLGNRVTVAQQRVETLRVSATTISARAVASLGALIDGARACSEIGTLWLLPRGKSGRTELEVVRHAVKGEFHVKQSLTDPDAVIVVATGIAPR